MKIKIDLLKKDPKINARGVVNPAQVDRMVASLKNGKSLPPIQITSDNIIIDGNHRYTALKKYGAKYCEVIVVKETDEAKLYEISLINNTGLQHTLYQKHINVYNLYHYGKSYPEISTLTGEKMTEATMRSIIKRVHYLHPDLLPELGDNLKVGVADKLICLSYEDQIEAFSKIKGLLVREALDVISDYSSETAKLPSRDTSYTKIVRDIEPSDTGDVISELGVLIDTYGSDKLKDWYNEFTSDPVTRK